MAEKKSSNDQSSEEMEVDDHAEQNVNGIEEDENGWRVSDDIYIPAPPQVFGEYDTTGPRLMLVKIVAENFKSYAGKVVIGPYHKCFSAIVGPNGNGKSNAIDSMLFVFGYRANKIRTKKVAELIHNSKEHPNCSSCTVSVYFQQIIDKSEEDYEVVPNSEFVISRTAFRDSTAYYELNGKKVQFKQIAQLLRSHHVDLDHNRFLILQGEVEQIALMKPKGQSEGDTGMLEFLEDIIGTTRYKEPLEKLFQRVEFLTEKRDEKLRRLKVAEKAKTDLEKPMQEAVQYLKGENSIIKLQHKYYQCKRYETSKMLAEEEESKKELDEDCNKLKEEMKSVQSEKEEKTAEFKEKSKKWDKLQSERDALSVQFAEIRKKDERLFAESVATNKRRKDNMSTVKNEKNKLEELLRVPAKNEKDIEECERLQKKQLIEREKEEAVLVTLMSGLKEKTEPLTKKRSKLEKELVSQKKFVDEAKSAYDIAKSKLDLYTSEEQTEKNKLEKLQETVKSTRERLIESKKKLAELESKIPLTQKSLHKAQSELENLKGRENEANMRLRNTRIKFDEQKSAMQAGKSRNRVLDALMQEKRAGRIPGIFGRLGDLGAIDLKYDVAVSTACGPLDNVVVDTVNTATECIKFLRNNDIGRTTFIALDKQQRFARQCQEKISTPENVHRLFDLIKVEDERILPAFYYSLQNTLVANDLEQAARIAYGAQRHRVVTLKGEMIEMSGTMSGGGRQSKGRMGQKVARSEPSTQDIEKLQRDLDKVFEEYNAIKAQQQPLENQIQTLNMALRDMIQDRDKLKIEVNQLSVEEPTLQKQIKEQEKKAKSCICDPAKVEEMTAVVEKAKQKLTNAEENSKDTENEVAHINHEIEEISGNRVKEQQKKISNLTKSIDKANAEVCRLNVAIKTAERNTKKLETHIETLETDIKSCEQRIRDIQKEKAECEEEAKNVMAEMSKLSEGLSERDDLVGEMKDALEKLRTRETKMKAVQIDLNQKLSQKNQVVKDLQHKIPELTAALERLKLQDIPNEENEDLADFSPEELEKMDMTAIASSLQKAKEKLPKEIPNMQIIEQYREHNALYLKRTEKLQKITEERNKMRECYNIAVRKRAQEFNAGFNLITEKLKEMYRMITLGGDAELELVDSLDAFSEGIVFSVRPPKKSWKYIQNLSGGEKTLSSLALVFALHHYKPTPVYFMDEIDAALDFKNVSIVANYIKERTKNAQFIVISHRSDMFELADYLVGIYKSHNCSDCTVLDMKKFNTKVGYSKPSPAPNPNACKPAFFSQPNPVSKALNANNENRADKVAKALHFPATCPSNVNRANENVNANVNSNKDNEENEPDLRLGDISLTITPMKTPAKTPVKQSRKRLAEESPTPKRERTLRKNNGVKEMQTVAEAIENTSTESSPDGAIVTPRRTSRITRKNKITEEPAKVSTKKLRKK